FNQDGDGHANFVRDDQRVVYNIETSVEGASQTLQQMGLLEKAGPREHIFFEPTKTHAAIVTCSGLCPGLNNVIRATVITLWYRYSVRHISGVPYGFRGLLPETGLPVRPLTPQVVSNIHQQSGTIL